MDIKELKTFKMIVEAGTFSLAAKKLNYAQSTVTTHIKKLEKELGFLLFERGWDARLTDEGNLFAEEVDNLLMHWDYSISQAQRISSEEKGKLRIGLLESFTKKLMPSILKYLNNEKPYIHCDFVVGNTALLSKMIDQNQIDFAVCGNNQNISNVNFTPLCKEQVEFIVNNPNHPVLQKESVEISDIINYPIFIGENSCYYYQSVNAFLLENNLAFKRVYNCSSLHLIPQMVVGDAIGIIPKGTVLNQNTISFKVNGYDPKFPIGLLISSKKRNYLSQTKQQLIKLIVSSM
ncbi:LysR family transcriptional regulator [Aneurinibacillus sp. Ricciae_BoGa-3]|uniref:LysR substrate-binding domain-containing protein n=1 Tax=Aneurinibacillus sp. Ricciae_BoGa-3 TaxID=3022697 RepID=UPI00233FE4F6|nr:LysR family transcriptional regulator [Aneurinibacillus sp. Ricciae_BoGa-3]WCK56286.1 LysR family transcriptional regulator [Aneurinibacillus sp. Ricciae_BoGa-3]